MAFRNEYIPSREKKDAEFFSRAKETLRTGYIKYDQWTADRERNMVLFREFCGPESGYYRENLWSFITADGKKWRIGTKQLSKKVVSPEEIALSYSVRARLEPSPRLDAAILEYFREALREYKDYGMSSDYKRCKLTLIDYSTGEEI